MKRHLLPTLVAGLLPLAALAAEMPLWELRVRMDSGGNTGFHDWLKEILSEKNEVLAGGSEELRVAGFNNPESPGQDWVANVGESADPPKVLEKTVAVWSLHASGVMEPAAPKGRINRGIWRPRSNCRPTHLVCA